LMLVLAAVAAPIVVMATAFGLLAMFRIAYTTSIDEPSALGPAAEERMAHHLPHPQTMMPPDQIVIPPAVVVQDTSHLEAAPDTSVRNGAVDSPEIVAVPAPVSTVTLAPSPETAKPDPTAPIAPTAPKAPMPIEQPPDEAADSAVASRPAILPDTVLPPPASPTATLPDDRPATTLEPSKPSPAAESGPAVTDGPNEMVRLATIAVAILPEKTPAPPPPEKTPAPPPKAHQTAKHHARVAIKRPHHRIAATPAYGYGAAAPFRTTPMQSTWTSSPSKFR